MTESKPVVCPHCGQTETVVRVSTVYENAHSPAVSKTLSRTLAPPPKPLFDFIEAYWRENKANNAGSIPVLIRLFFSLIMAALMVPITMAVFYGIFAKANLQFSDLGGPGRGGGPAAFLPVIWRGWPPQYRY